MSTVRVTQNRTMAMTAGSAPLLLPRLWYTRGRWRFNQLKYKTPETNFSSPSSTSRYIFNIRDEHASCRVVDGYSRVAHLQRSTRRSKARAIGRALRVQVSCRGRTGVLIKTGLYRNICSSAAEIPIAARGMIKKYSSFLQRSLRELIFLLPPQKYSVLSKKN